MPGLSLFSAGHRGRGTLSRVPSAFVKAFGAQACRSPENRVCAWKAGLQADSPGGGGSFPSADLQLCHLGQGCSSFCCQDEWGATASWGPRVLWASALPPLTVFTSGYGESKSNGCRSNFLLAQHRKEGQPLFSRSGLPLQSH